MRICERCGTPNDESAQFCDTCGTPLAGSPPDQGATEAGGGGEQPTGPAAGGDAPTRIGPVPGGHGPPAYGGPGPGGYPGAGGGGGGQPPYAAPPGQPGGAWPPAPQQPPPSGPRRSPLLPVILGLAALLLVAGAGAGIYFGLVKDNGKDKGTTSDARTTATQDTTASGSSTDSGSTDTTGTTTTTGGPSAQPSFLVNVCGRLSPARRCGAPAFVRSRTDKQFFVWLSVRRAPRGRLVRILLQDSTTGKNLVSPTRYKTTGAAKDIFTLRISGGPFRPLKAAIRVLYGSRMIKFARPLRLTLR